MTKELERLRERVKENMRQFMDAKSGSFIQIDALVDAAMAAFDTESLAAQPTPKEPGLRTAAQAVWELIEQGKLVRDISGDGESDWAIKQIPVVCALADLQRCLASPVPSTDGVHVSDRSSVPMSGWCYSGNHATCLMNGCECQCHTTAPPRDIYCPACSEAGGGDKGIYHLPPACKPAAPRDSRAQTVADCIALFPTARPGFEISVDTTEIVRRLQTAAPQPSETPAPEESK